MWAKRPLAVLLLASVVISLADAMIRYWGESALLLYFDPLLAEHWWLFRALEWVLMIVGAIVFGLISDRSGRRQGLVGALLLATAGAVAFAVMSTDSIVGDTGRIGAFVATAALSLAFGGVIGAGLAWIFESAPQGRSGSYIARWEVASQTGAAVSIVVSMAVVAAAHSMLDFDVHSSWTWRMPILVAAALLLLLTIMLRRVPEPDQAVAWGALSPWVVILAGVVAFAGTAASHVHDSYLDTFTLERLQAVVHASESHFVLYAFLAGIAGTLIGGWLTDRLGPRRSAIGGLFASLAVTGTTGLVAHVITSIAVAAAMSVLAAGAFAVAIPGVIVSIARQLPTGLRATGLGTISCLSIALIGWIAGPARMGTPTTTGLIVQGGIIAIALIAAWILTARKLESQPAN
jgi:MHS family alpha-ketoglutarate permease-like MFS transporter